MNDALIAYVPVLHEGYRRMFTKHAGAVLYLVTPALVAKEFPLLARDRRQLPVEDMLRVIRALELFSDVAVLSDEDLSQLNASARRVILPDDEVGCALATHLGSCSVTYETPFLRWDKTVTLQDLDVHPDTIVTQEEVDRSFMARASEEAQKSGDWWRQVGAVAVCEGEARYTGFNKHHPTEHAVYANGNPRDNFDAGQHPEISLTLHGEASIVAQAARDGVSLRGASVYVTTFPCVNCARLLAETSVGKVYYRDGYSRLDAEEVLKDHGVEIIRVV